MGPRFLTSGRVVIQSHSLFFLKLIHRVKENALVGAHCGSKSPKGWVPRHSPVLKKKPAPGRGAGQALQPTHDYMGVIAGNAFVKMQHGLFYCVHLLFLLLHSQNMIKDFLGVLGMTINAEQIMIETTTHYHTLHHANNQNMGRSQTLLHK